MVEGGGGGDGEGIALIPVPFCIHAVQGKGHDRQYVGCDRGAGPCGINLAGSHIFDIVRVTDIVILGRTVSGRTVVNDNIFRNDNAAQYDLAGGADRLDLGFGDLRWIIAEEGMCGNRIVLKASGSLFWRKFYILQGQRTGKKLRPRDGKRFIAICLDLEGIFRIRLVFTWFHTVLKGRSRKLHGF